MQYQAGNCETHRHFSPNTAFKMIEEIEDESTLNTIAVAAKRGMMPLGQLLLNFQRDHLDRSKIAAGTLNASTMKEVGRPRRRRLSNVLRISER
jgi:hypothetical protein